MKVKAKSDIKVVARLSSSGIVFLGSVLDMCYFLLPTISTHVAHSSLEKAKPREFEVDLTLTSRKRQCQDSIIIEVRCSF